MIRLTRVVAAACAGAFVVYLAGELFGGDWPWLVDHRGWLMLAGAALAVKIL